MARSKPKKAAPKARKSKAKKPARKVTRTAAKASRKPAAKRKAPAARPAGASAATSPAMRALAQRIIDVTLADDDESIMGLYAAGIESSEAGQPPTVGIDALRGKLAGWRNMVSDSHFEPRRVLVDGNTIAIQWVGRVTLTASGRQAELHEVAVHEIRDGKIVREAFFYNPAALA